MIPAWDIIGPGPHVCWFAQSNTCLHPEVPVVCGHDDGVQRSDAGMAHHIDGNHDNNDPLNIAPCHHGCHTLHHSTGRHHSEETRQRLSEVGMGRQHLEETKRKISDSMMGRSVSDSTRQLLSESASGRHHTEETKQRISETLIGHLMSDETRQRQSEAHTGVYHTEESKQKMRESAKRRWARERGEEA